ncbi:MAG: HD domain-containing phosphohydrolase [Nitrospiria bacterium]
MKLSEVMSALSYALDITEGQPMGHAARSCLLGMRLAMEIGVPPDRQSALFYGLLLKDAGCSSNAARMSSLFAADDRRLKRDTKTIDWSHLGHSLIYVACHALPHGSILERAVKILGIGLRGPRVAKELVEIRCERGADIARMLDFPEETAEAIRALDEHWDGRGHPRGLRGREIPLLGRIMGLAQTVEVFFTAHGAAAACAMARSRRGRRFDPDLVDALASIEPDAVFWDRMRAADPHEHVGAMEPLERAIAVDDARLDRIAQAFAKVVDAKSPWTYRHSERVAEVALGIGRILGFSQPALRDLRRAALLHDIGKLGVSNLILDKPGRLTPDERTEMCRHTGYTHDILGRVASFRGVAHLAASHHERLDGKGYHRGLAAADLSAAARVLPVADVYEALSADRPYRPALPRHQIFNLMHAEAGAGLCPRALSALEQYLREHELAPVAHAA